MSKKNKKSELICDGNFLIDRRSLIAASLTAVGGFMMPPFMREAMAMGHPLPTGTGESTTMIYVFLRGGMDGLSLLPPSPQDKANHAIYQSLRPTTSIYQTNAAVPHLSNAPFGIHPKASHIHAAYEAGGLAFLTGAGSPSESRSHFIQQKLIESGAPEATHPGVTGYLNRALGLVSVDAKSSRMPAVSMGAGLAYSLRGPELAQVVPRLTTTLNNPGVSSPNDLRSRLGMGWTEPNGLNRHIDNLLGSKGNQAIKGLNAIQDAITLGTSSLSPLNDSSGAAIHYAGQSNFRDAAQLVKSEPGIRFVTIDVNGWDHHSSVTSRFDSGISKLDMALGALIKDLGGPIGSSQNTESKELWNRVCIVVMSEFGRRVGENITSGFDHGRGGVMMVAGGRVNGKKVVKSPSYDLKNLDQGDIAVTSDYRDVVTEVLKEIVGIKNPQNVFSSSYTYASKNLIKKG